LAKELQNSGYPHPATFAFAPRNKPGILKEYEKMARTDCDGGRIGTLALTTTGIEAAPEKMHVEVKPSKNKSWRDVTDDEIDNYVRRVAHISLHYSCTCPMSNDDKTGVVDRRLLVHGFKNLRIADASVCPKIMSGHTMAPVMMVAARCADFIKEMWQLDISDDLDP
jgi:choline dehydrogenase-like flavoprotein